MEYIYFKNISPNLDYVHQYIIDSVMTDKNILYCRWDEINKKLKIYWNDELSLSDKQILDTIIGEL